ncbi:hypothetical protein V2I01_23040 [Micromonospora sp. BRA006-A]|nr:hypothetical protein [Micromonospora sp. BRA006-A]
MRRLLLTHLWPGTEPREALTAVRRGFAGPVEVAAPGLTVTVGR